MRLGAAPQKSNIRHASFHQQPYSVSSGAVILGIARLAVGILSAASQLDVPPILGTLLHFVEPEVLTHGCTK